MDETDWRISVGQHEYRAANIGMVREWVEGGRLPSTASIWHPEVKNWQPILEVQELKEAFDRRAGFVATSQQAASSQGSSSSSSRGCLIALGIIAAFCLFVFIAGTLTPTRKTSSGPAVSTPVAPGTPTLYVSGLDKVVVCRTEEAFERFLRASAGKDSYGHAELALSGACVLVQNGTKVQVLDYGFARHQIRILDGPESGTSGWVPREWVVNR